MATKPKAQTDKAQGGSVAEKKRVGRPSMYTQAIADEICDRIATGEPLRVICRDSHIPSWRTVYDWMDAHQEFSARIAHARELGYDAIAEEALAIADTPLEGIRVEESTTGKKTVSEDMLGHRRLQVETRLKLLAKWSPKKYGDKVAAEITGKDGGPIETKEVSELEAARRIAFALTLGLKAAGEKESSSDKSVATTK